MTHLHVKLELIPSVVLLRNGITVTLSNNNNNLRYYIVLILVKLINTTGYSKDIYIYIYITIKKKNLCET